MPALCAWAAVRWCLRVFLAVVPLLSAALGLAHARAGLATGALICLAPWDGWWMRREQMGPDLHGSYSGWEVSDSLSFPVHIPTGLDREWQKGGEAAVRLRRDIIYIYIFDG